MSSTYNTGTFNVNFFMYTCTGGFERSNGIMYLQLLSRYKRSATATAWVLSIFSTLRLILGKWVSSRNIYLCFKLYKYLNICFDIRFHLQFNAFQNYLFSVNFYAFNFIQPIYSFFEIMESTQQKYYHDIMNETKMLTYIHENLASTSTRLTTRILSLFKAHLQVFCATGFLLASL